MTLNARLARVWAPAVVLTVFVCVLVATARREPPTQEPVPSLPDLVSTGLYADDPSHLWNRVHRQLFVRVADDGHEHGFDEVDPLLWRETKFLLTEPSHASAIRVLDEFLETDGERLITDPLRRAVFQHDLWAVFDWAAVSRVGEPGARTALLTRLARIIRRVALDREEIARLPDTYSAAVASGAFPDRFDPASPDRTFLPRDLVERDGDWIAVGGSDPVAEQHAFELSRSAFGVFWQVPGGAGPTREYLQTLWDFPAPFVSGDFNPAGEQRAMVNPDLPPVPGGTQLVLVRTMLVIDGSGGVLPTPVVEGVQLRIVGPGRSVFGAFKLRRGLLFSGGQGGLRPSTQADQDFITFSSHGRDAFEDDHAWRGRPALSGCRNCHENIDVPLVQSVRSLPRVLRPSTLVDTRHERWSRWLTQGAVAVTHKTRRADFGRLQGLWESNPW
jgi:hypothetical protein